jgi:hypothetical protein
MYTKLLGNLEVTQKIKNKKILNSLSSKKIVYIRTTPGKVLFNQTIKNFL